MRTSPMEQPFVSVPLDSPWQKSDTKLFQSGWHRLKLKSDSFIEVPGLSANTCGAAMKHPSLFVLQSSLINPSWWWSSGGLSYRACGYQWQLQYLLALWWSQIPQAHRGSKKNPKQRQREEDSLHERETRSLECRIPQILFMGNTQGKKTEGQINIFSSCFVMTLGLFCIRKYVPSSRRTPWLSNLL